MQTEDGRGGRLNRASLSCLPVFLQRLWGIQMMLGRDGRYQMLLSSPQQAVTMSSQRSTAPGSPEAGGKMPFFLSAIQQWWDLLLLFPWQPEHSLISTAA